MLLLLKNLLFTVFVPGTVAVVIPYRIASRTGPGLVLEGARPLSAAPLFLLGAAIYFLCLWDFAVTGRGTPAPIDPPKQIGTPHASTPVTLQSRIPSSPSKNT